MPFSLPNPFAPRRRRTPTLLQMEAAECGAAALGIILGYHGRFVSLEELRVACGVSRDGSKASNIVRAARTYGLTAQGFRKEPEDLPDLQLPVIVFWNFNHFLVVEGFSKGRVYLNDPATGPRVVSADEFDKAFTGVVLTFEPGPQFEQSKDDRQFYQALRRRLSGSGMGLLFVVLASLALVLPGLVIPIFTKVFIDEILVQGFTDWLKPLLLGMGFAALLQAGLTWLREYYLLRLETKLSLATSSAFLWHVLRLPISFFTHRLAGEIGSRVEINDDVATLLSGRLATNLLNGLVVLFYALIMFYYDVVLTLIGIGMAMLNLVVLRVVSRRRVDLSQNLLQESGKLMGTSMEGVRTIETLKATGTEGEFFSRWAGYQANVLNAQQRLGLSSRGLHAIPALLYTLNTIVILSVGGLRVMEGLLSMGMLVAFQSLMANFLGPFNEMVYMGSSLQEMRADLNRLDDVLGHEPDPLVIQGEQQDPGGVVELTGMVELHHITFGYSRLAPPLIEDFNITLTPGSRVALVGGSGCGKSTLARIVCGLLDPWEGEVWFDGKPRAEIPRSILTSFFAMVDQDIFLFEGSIRDNLSLWDSTVPETHIIQAAKDACIHEVITQRQGGYDAWIEEGGRNFSGGQQQRLEIARALVNNPTILVLDEATSALDPQTEKKIDENLRRRGCTCLIVAHRLSTIRDCDEIIMLDTGKVIQRGTHEAMRAAADQPYAALIQDI